MKKAILFGVLAGGAVAVGVSYAYREQLRARLLDVIESYKHAEADLKLRQSEPFQEAVLDMLKNRDQGTTLYPQPEEPVRPGAGAYEEGTEPPQRSMHEDFKE